MSMSLDYRNELSLFYKDLQRINSIPSIDSNYLLASNELSKLVKRGLLSYEDILNKPEKFLAFHAAIPEFNNLGGFGIRFTVQYNLFAGSIMTLGMQHHKAILVNSGEQGDLGCFMLTEYNSGVVSGMVCATVVTTTFELLNK